MGYFSLGSIWPMESAASAYQAHRDIFCVFAGSEESSPLFSGKDFDTGTSRPLVILQLESIVA